MKKIDILCESRYLVNRVRIRQAVEKTLAENNLHDGYEVCVVISGERKMSELHKKYLQEDGPTDVMSFPLEGVEYPDDRMRLGDIVVCYPVAVRQAGENNRMVDDEIDFLVSHGCLHLMGIHHE